MRLRYLLATLLLLWAAVAAQAASKVALVIGNGAYVNANVLPNPTNDAADVTAKLQELGFQVFGGTDLTFVDMGTRIGEFEDAARDADVTLLFYAGHGMQVNGRNYLIPVDAKLERESSLKFQTIDAEDVLRAMSGPGKTAIALLDACRDNPLSRRFSRSLGTTRSNAVQQGLAVPNISGGGMLIGFATAPGDVAADGDGRNSPFTTALLKHISTPGLEIQQLMTRVKREVYNSTKENQEPWHNSSLRDEIYLGGEAKQAEPPPKVEADNTTVSQEWNLVKDTTSVLVLEAFMAAYADKPLFVALAQERMENLVAAQQDRQAKDNEAKSAAEKQAQADAQALAAEQQARLEEIERQRQELDKSKAEFERAKQAASAREEEQPAPPVETDKPLLEREAADAEIARQKAEFKKFLAQQKQSAQVAEPVITPAPPKESNTDSPPASSDGKDSFLNFFFGSDAQPPVQNVPADTQLALNDDPPPPPPAEVENTLFDDYLRAAMRANQKDLSLIYAVGNVMVLPRPDQNPGNKTRAMAAKRIASAATMEALLQDNPGLTFTSSANGNCRIQFCNQLPQALKEKIQKRRSSVAETLQGDTGTINIQPLANSDRYLVSNSLLLDDDRKPTVFVMAVVDVELNVEKVFSLAILKEDTGVEADPKFGSLSITGAAVDGDDLIISIDSNSRCDDKPRRMGLLLRFGLGDQVIKWVSPFNVSNTNFIVTDQHIYSSDGGSCQDDHVYQLDKQTGEVVSRFKVKTSADDLWLHGNKLVMQLYEGAEAWQLK